MTVRSVAIECMECHTDYTLGKDAWVVTGDDIRTAPALSLSLGTRQPDGGKDNPDLIAASPGLEQIEMDPDKARRQQHTVSRIANQLAQGLPRWWQCYNCKQVQRYSISHEGKHDSTLKRDVIKSKAALDNSGGDIAPSGSTPHTVNSTASVPIAHSPLEMILILYNKDFAGKDDFARELLMMMSVHGRRYLEWIGDNTATEIHVYPELDDNPDSHGIPFALFRFSFFRKSKYGIGSSSNIDNVTKDSAYAPFQASKGVSGVLHSLWHSDAFSDTGLPLADEV